MAADQNRPAKLQDIAEKIGVSVSTVSRALAGHSSISEETRLLVRKIAEEHNYDLGRKLRGADRKQITVVMPVLPYGAPKMAEPFSLSLLGGIGTAMREREIDFSISYRVPRDNDTLYELMDSYPYGGFIFLGQSQFHDALNKFARQGRAFAVWGAELAHQEYCSIGTDNVFGGQRATSHLLRLGRQRIAFLGAINLMEIEQRVEGYKAAIEQAGLFVDKSLIQACRLTYEAAFDAVDDLLDKGLHFDGIVAASDMLAVGAIRALGRRGIEVPRDVSVVGYDDVDIASYTHPALTTIRQDVVKAGSLLVSKVVRRLSGHSAPSERVPTELIVRESCGA
jgi:DNA-binding LacI/PurR family transcriptional regulator